MAYLHRGSRSWADYRGWRPSGSEYGAAAFGRVSLGEPVFAINCPDPPGCAPADAGQCRAILRQAVRNAIELAENAANKLEALDPSKGPADPSTQAERDKTAKFFKAFFGHPPSHPIPWANGEDSAISVIKRFRAVANALKKGGRNVTFRCLPATAGCPNDMTCCRTVAVARIHPDARNTVFLCPLFWDPPTFPGLSTVAFRGSTILHEMLHLLFIEFLRHHEQARRANAFCYHVFALRIAGYGVPADDRCFCRTGAPCA
jgi:hypothetical protein